MNHPHPAQPQPAEEGLDDILATQEGRLHGALQPATHKRAAVRSWKGIPYAAAPVGRLRWRPPQPLAPWSGVRAATEFGPDFPQAPSPRLRAPAMSEDCLYLNVWSPVGATAGSLPVMVWVHGGGFAAGSGADIRSDGEAMAARGVVVVSFNYRAGLFGFIAHPALSAESPHGVSGNYGLLDQLAALQWVRRNIAGFGGNPQRVTAFGVSAGSASLSLLLTSDMARGLFQQAILHSPGACRPLATLADAEQASSAALGSDIAALRALTAQELFAKTALMSPKMRGLTTPRVLRPIRDGWLLREDERPVFKSLRLHAMPLLVGSNADEGTQLTSTWPIDTVAQYEAVIAGNFGKAAPEARAVYPASSDAEARPRVAEIFADTQFNYGTRLLAQSMAAVEPRCWRYVFLRRRPDQHDGPHHGEEVPYVFGNVAATVADGTAVFDAADLRVSEAMLRAWVAFAAAGDPNVEGQTHWPAYDAALDNHLVFDTGITPGRGWRARQLDFLDRFYGPV